jgi:hypothetical protein
VTINQYAHYKGRILSIFVHFFPLARAMFLSSLPLSLGYMTTLLVDWPYNRAHSWIHTLQHKDGGSMSFQNVGICTKSTVSQPRRPQS